MGIFDRFKRRQPTAQQQEIAKEVPVLEVEPGAEVRKLSEAEILVKSMTLQSLADVPNVASELQAGNILVLDISALMEQDPADLKRAIDQLKGISQGIGGDVGRLSETKVLVTPRFVRIQFKKEAEASF